MTADLEDAGEIRVLTFAELAAMARGAYPGGSDAFERRVSELAGKKSPGADARERGIEIIEEFIRVAHVKRPFIAAGFLPPYIPPRTSLDGRPSREPLLAAVDKMIDYAGSRHGVTIEKAEFFSGICDLSFAGFSGGADEARVFAENCPAAEKLYRIPFDDMAEIDVPVANIGVFGRDAHKFTERLEKNYSLRVIPELIEYFLGSLSEEWDKKFAASRAR
jgi:arginine utilization protein RocB